MKLNFTKFFFLFFIFYTNVSLVLAQYKNSPYNYNNSPYNYNNSPYNYKNSPYNNNFNNKINKLLINKKINNFNTNY